MIRKKGSFLTFCFSLLPGAGQMYMGFMKRGTSLMSFFFLLIFLSAWLNLGPLMLIVPIIWFYAFFDTHNLHTMADDEFYAMEDDYILYPEIVKEKHRILQGKYRNVLGIGLVVIGISILWNNLYDILRWSLPEVISTILYKIGYFFPQFFVGAAIIALGLYLIRGKKKDLDEIEKLNMPEDKGGRPLC